MNDFKNLHHASNVSNNSNLKLYSNSSIVTIVYFHYEEIQIKNISVTGINNNIDNTKNQFFNPIQDINKHNFNGFKNIQNKISKESINFRINNNTYLNNNNLNDMNKLKNSNNDPVKETTVKKVLLTLHQSNILIPYFYDGLSTLQFLNKCSKYIIVGNKNSQIFYIYENFPPTNLKNNLTTKAKRCIFKTKISYSVFRGITKGIINNIDMSHCNKYLIISSNKGTFHLFSIPKKNEQINENSNMFNYEFYNEENNKICNAIDIDKIKYSSFIENCGNYVFKTASKLLSRCKIDIDDLENDIKKQIVESNFNKKIIANLLVNFSEYDNSIYIHLIQSGKKENNEYEGNFNGFNFGVFNSSFFNNNISSNIYNNDNSIIDNYKSINNNRNFSLNNKNYVKSINDSNSIKDKNSEENITKKDKIYLIKKIDLGESFIKNNTNSNNIQGNNTNNYLEKISEINNNFKSLLHKIKQIHYKSRQTFKQFIDLETTTRNFPTMQTHPLFTFNFYKKQRTSANNYNNSNNNVNTNLNLQNNNNNFNSANVYVNGNLNKIINNNKHSRNNHNIIYSNNLNSNNSNNNFQIISNNNNTLTNNNNSSNNNIGANSFVNISSSNINKNDSNTENLEIIIDNDKKEEFVNVEIKDISHTEKNNNKNENIKKIKKEKISNMKRKSIIKEKVKNINLKFKKHNLYKNSLSINSSSYSLGSSLEKNKIKFLIDKDESNKDLSNSHNTTKSFNNINGNSNFEILNMENLIHHKELEINEIDSQIKINKNENLPEEKKDFTKAFINNKNNLNENLRFLNKDNNLKSNNNIKNFNNDNNKNYKNSLSNKIDLESKNSLISNKSIKEIKEIKNSGNLTSIKMSLNNQNNYNICNLNNNNNNNNYKILTHKKSFESSNNNQIVNVNSNNNMISHSNNYSNLNISTIDNLLAEKYICNEFEYFEINFNSNKSIIQKSDFFLDNYMGPKLIINPFDIFSSKNNSRKNTKENNDLKQNKNGLKNENIEKEILENNSINVNMNNMNFNNNNENDDFFNNKDYILKKKIQEAINSNIMERIISSSDTIVKFSGEIRIDEDYIKK